MEKVRKKIKTKNKFLLFILCVSLLGCQPQSVQIEESDALELALDRAGLDEEDVTSCEVDEKESYYKISFNTEEGTYDYTINKDGVIEEWKYTPATETSSSESNSTSKSEEKKSDETSKTTEENKSTSDLTDEQQQLALNAACNNMGISTTDISKYSCSMEDGNIVVRIQYPNETTIHVTVVDASTYVATSYYKE